MTSACFIPIWSFGGFLSHRGTSVIIHFSLGFSRPKILSIISKNRPNHFWGTPARKASIQATDVPRADAEHFIGGVEVVQGHPHLVKVAGAKWTKIHGTFMGIEGCLMGFHGIYRIIWNYISRENQLFNYGQVTYEMTMTDWGWTVQAYQQYLFAFF